MSNFTVLQELREFKDEEKFREFMQEAHVQLKQQGALLMTELSRANWAAAQRLAHRLKGTMGSLGCENLHDVLQSRLSGDTPPAVPTPVAWDALEAAQQSTLVALKELLSLK